MSKTKFRRIKRKMNLKHYNILMQYFYNIYMNSQEAEGIDSDTLNYRLKLFWEEGQAAIYQIPTIKEIAYAPFNIAGGYNHNGFPVSCYLVDQFGVGRKIVPYGNLKVNKDVVIAYALASHRPIKEVVEYQVQRICDVRNAINQNLHTNMLPYLIKSSSNDARLKNVFDDVFAGEEIVAVSPEDISSIDNSLQLNPTYLIDKLQAYEKDLFNELLTFLGVNNMGNQEKKERMITGEIDSNNELISIFGECFMRESRIESKKIKEVFDVDVTFKDTTPQFMIEKEGASNDIKR